MKLQDQDTERDYVQLYPEVEALQLTEDEAITVFSVLREMFDWSGGPWCSGDIEEEIEWYIDQHPDLSDHCTDEVVANLVQRVKDDRLWRKYLPDQTTQLGNEMLSDHIALILRKYFAEKGVDIEDTLD